MQMACNTFLLSQVLLVLFIIPGWLFKADVTHHGDPKCSKLYVYTFIHSPNLTKKLISQIIFVSAVDRGGK